MDQRRDSTVRVVGGIFTHTDAYAYDAYSDAYRGRDGYKNAYADTDTHRNGYGHSTHLYADQDANANRCHVHTQRHADTHANAATARPAVPVQ